jgi:uncharacterized membrane protein YhaH (DUF805 family)
MFMDTSVGNPHAIIQIIVIFFLAIQGSKRMHDIGKSGWYYLILPYFIILSFKKSFEGNNQYGTFTKVSNSLEKALFDCVITLLVSAFFSCLILAIISIQNFHQFSEIIKQNVFLFSFAIFNFLFLQVNIKNEN